MPHFLPSAYATQVFAFTYGEWSEFTPIPLREDS